MKLKIKNKECKIENKLSNFRNVILNLFQDLKSIEFSKNTKNKMLKQADLRTAFTPVSENIELTEPIRLENEIIRARSKSKTVQHDMKKAAFTLAEVLITLGIIGVVAALTMPTLIQNHQKHETEVRIKKVYSTFSQALQLSQVENGEFEDWDWSLDEGSILQKYIFPYLKITKDCGITENLNECSITGKSLSGRRTFGHDAANYGFVGVDGTKCGFLKVTNGFQIKLDINGNKGPNIFGKDIFFLHYRPVNNVYKLVYSPLSQYTDIDTIKSDTTYGCNKMETSSAAWCGGWIQLNGWKIPDDYPW